MRKLMIAFIATAIAFLALAPGAGAAQTPVAIAGTGCVGGTLYCYSPANVTIQDGDTVVWTNQTVAPHTVSRCSPATCAGNAAGTGTDATFTSGTVGGGNGTTFSHTFHGAGTYAYFCTIHGYAVMHGTVTVLAAPTATTPVTIAATPGAGSATPATTAANSGAMRSTTSNGSQAANRALARTGANASLWAIAGAALLGAGALLALAHRRARRAIPPHH
jgi:LPXTG-motif cell wall-anchored protein